MNPDTSPPAFPRPAFDPQSPSTDLSRDERSIMRHGGNSGMTLRQWYAGMALQGILAAQAGSDGPLPAEDEVAEWAFEYADGMLEHELDERIGADEEEKKEQEAKS